MALCINESFSLALDDVVTICYQPFFRGSEASSRWQGQGHKTILEFWQLILRSSINFLEFYVSFWKLAIYFALQQPK